jgi:hypothetical protein
MSEIKYEVVKKIGVLSKSASGWSKELNLISLIYTGTPPLEESLPALKGFLLRSIGVSEDCLPPMDK